MRIRIKPKQTHALPKETLDAILQSYRVENCDMAEVESFLSENGFLIPVLIDAVKRIKTAFKSSPIYLKVEKDPEEGYEELIGNIAVEGQEEEAIKTLAHFYSEWFNSVADQVKHKLNFTVNRER